jgi:hypothetical protein
MHNLWTKTQTLVSLLFRYIRRFSIPSLPKDFLGCLTASTKSFNRIILLRQILDLVRPHTSLNTCCSDQSSLQDFCHILLLTGTFRIQEHGSDPIVSMESANLLPLHSSDTFVDLSRIGCAFVDHAFYPPALVFHTCLRLCETSETQC